MKSLEELKAIREKTKAEISLRDDKHDFRIVVGMATCGIAAGARPVMHAFVEELNKKADKCCRNNDWLHGYVPFGAHC